MNRPTGNRHGFLYKTYNPIKGACPHKSKGNPLQVKGNVKGSGTQKGLDKSLKILSWILEICVALGLIWWKCHVDKNAKLTTQDNGSSNKMKEQNNASKNKKEEINAQSSADLAKIQAETEAKKSVLETREKLRQERMRQKSFMLEDSNDTVESYAEAQANGHLSGENEKFLGFPYFKVGYSRAFVGAANVGKTTYILQEAVAIAGGHCNVPLTANWLPIPPVHVIVFSLEQTMWEIEEHWGAAIDPVKSHFHIYCGQISPKQIITTVKDYLEISNEYGVVVYIDNEGKLEEYASCQEIAEMNRELEHIRQTAFKTQHPLTTVKVYHTSSDYDPSKRFTLKSVRGNKNNVNLNNDVMFITHTNLGEDKRIVGFLKNKHGKVGRVNVIEIAGTDVDQFRYVGEAMEADVLRSKNEETESVNPAVVFNPHKPGRKPTITVEQAQELQDLVTRGEKTWAQIQKETGHSKSKVKECIRSSKKRDGGQG